MQAAPDLDNIDLVMLGYELCAAFTPNGFSETGVIDIEPLTCIDNINKYLGYLKDVRGAKQVRKASRYILDNAASPPEVKTPMLATLPCRWGGYGFPTPELNCAVEIDPTRISTNKQSYRCDAFFRDANLALEYQSDLCHAAPWKYREDQKRINDLQSAGIKVLQVNSDHLRDPYAFNKLALQIADLTKQRVREDRFELTDERRKLHERLKHTDFWSR